MSEFLRDRTYMVRHNPNCPKPFEVRLAGRAAVVVAPPVPHVIEGMNRWDDHQARLNDVGYGTTFEEAAQAALDVGARRRGAQLFREIWQGL